MTPKSLHHRSDIQICDPFGLHLEMNSGHEAAHMHHHTGASRSQPSSRGDIVHHTYWLTPLLACTKKSIFRQHDALIQLCTRVVHHDVFIRVFMFLTDFFFWTTVTGKVIDQLQEPKQRARTTYPCS
jgi:hypothetical protein